MKTEKRYVQRPSKVSELSKMRTAVRFIMLAAWAKLWNRWGRQWGDGVRNVQNSRSGKIFSVNENLNRMSKSISGMRLDSKSGCAQRVSKLSGMPGGIRMVCAQWLSGMSGIRLGCSAVRPGRGGLPQLLNAKDLCSAAKGRIMVNYFYHFPRRDRAPT